LKTEEKIIENQKFKSVKSTSSSTSETSSMIKIEPKLSSVSSKSTHYEETEKGSSSSMLSWNSTSRSSYKMTNLKRAELQQMNLPAINCEKTTKCNVCLESHQIYNCDSYLSKTSRGRYAIVTKLKLCRNCLRPGHKAVNCRNEKKCKKCNKKHHTTLHYTKPSSNTTETQNIKIVKSKQKSLIPVPIKVCKLQNLTTVRILIPDAKGNWQSVEAIIDTASNKNKLKQNVREHKVKIESTERDIANDLTSVHGLRHKKSEKLSNSRPKNQEYQLTTDSSYSTNCKNRKREMSTDKNLNRVSKKHKFSIKSTSSRTSQHDLNQVNSTTSCASDKKSSYAESNKSFESIVQSRGQSLVTLNKNIKQY